MNQMQATSPTDSSAPWLPLAALGEWAHAATALRLRNRDGIPIYF